MLMEITFECLILKYYKLLRYFGMVCVLKFLDCIIYMNVCWCVIVVVVNITIISLFCLVSSELLYLLELC